MSKFRKKPVVIEAVQFTGRNVSEVHAFTGSKSTTSTHAHSAAPASSLTIETLEGIITASPGDWIIRGVKGEFYPCKPDIFAATYEPVEP